MPLSMVSLAQAYEESNMQQDIRQTAALGSKSGGIWNSRIPGFTRKWRRGWFIITTTAILVQSLIPLIQPSQARELRPPKASLGSAPAISRGHAKSLVDVAPSQIETPPSVPFDSHTHLPAADDPPLRDSGIFVIYEKDGVSTCRGATPDEARRLRRRDGSIPLNVISPMSTDAVHAGLKIILRATPQLESNPEAKTAFLRAAATWEAVIQSPITIVIDVDYGPTRFGEPFPSPTIIGSTDPQIIGSDSFYPKVRASLLSGASSAQESALYNLLPSTTIPTYLGATAGVAAPSATLRALGILNPVANPDAELAQLGEPPSVDSTRRCCLISTRMTVSIPIGSISILRLFMKLAMRWGLLRWQARANSARVRQFSLQSGTCLDFGRARHCPRSRAQPAFCPPGERRGSSLAIRNWRSRPGDPINPAAMGDKPLTGRMTRLPGNTSALWIQPWSQACISPLAQMIERR